MENQKHGIPALISFFIRAPWVFPIVLLIGGASLSLDSFRQIVNDYSTNNRKG